MSNTRAHRQWQNAMNNAQGHILENVIKAGCARYAARGMAEIDKTPEPFRVTEKSRDGVFKGRFTARAAPDFQGTLAGGRSIVFEAKYTTTNRMRFDALTKEQQARLESHAAHGALSAVCVGIEGGFYFIPWEIWRGMKTRFGHKYVTAADMEPWRVRFDGAVLFLDYIHESGRESLT